MPDRLLPDGVSWRRWRVKPVDHWICRSSIGDTVKLACALYRSRSSNGIMPVSFWKEPDMKYCRAWLPPRTDMLYVWYHCAPGNRQAPSAEPLASPHQRSPLATSSNGVEAVSSVSPSPGTTQ